MRTRHTGFAVRVGLLFGAIFLVYGAQVPFLPVWLGLRGLSAAEISVVSATPLILRLIATPALAFLADRSGDHRRFVVGLAWCALAAGVLLANAATFWTILLFSTLSAMCLSTLMPLTETVAMAGVRRAGLDYGRMRLWGSLTFIAASFFGGAAVERLGAEAGIWAIVVGLACTVMAAHLLPASEAPAETGGHRRIRAADALALATSPVMLVFMLAAGAVQSAHAVFYTFGALHWHAQGISPVLVGVLWSIGVLGEIVLFYYSKAVVAAVGPVELIVIGALASVVRWLGMSFDPPLALLVPLQVLHALSYGAAHLGAIHFIGRAVPQMQAGTAQALYATITAGIGMAGATLIGGRYYAAWGGRTYLLMVVLAIVALTASLALKRIWREGEIAMKA